MKMKDDVPPGMLVVSRIKFFNPTANDSSPACPVAGSCPIAKVRYHKFVFGF